MGYFLDILCILKAVYDVTSHRKAQTNLLEVQITLIYIFSKSARYRARLLLADQTAYYSITSS